MHKSSQLTFVYKYLFFPLWAGIFTIGIISNWNKTDEFSQNWVRTALPMVCFASVWLIMMMIRLRNVEASEEYLTIKTLKGRKIVDYKDIEWISQYAMINPPMISMKYMDIDSGKTQKILILLPKEFRGFNLASETEMTTFIRERIMASRPDYSKASEPNRWIALIWVLATAIPIAVLVNLLVRLH